MRRRLTALRRDVASFASFVRRFDRCPLRLTATRAAKKRPIAVEWLADGLREGAAYRHRRASVVTHMIVEAYASGGRRRYADPVATIVAHERADVCAALARCDDALRDGWSVAGYIAYEAGSAFEDLETPPLPEGRPYLEIGVFSGTSEAVASDDSQEMSLASLGPLVTDLTRERYASDLAAIGASIYAGDVYQVNYTVPFAFAYSGDPETLFARLRASARVGYAASVRTARRTILSLSPELFLEFDGERVRTRPMKGTASNDAARELDSAKNRAEHVMIVDLLRNDLHRVCDDVRTGELFTVERYPTFSTGVTTIEGTLASETRFSDVIRATFPCGSVTGAPKRSALERIAALERAPRDIAMGTIGYCDPGLRGIWNVAIRTLDLDTTAGTGVVRIGGGIVADSNARDEWAEILVKRRVFDALVGPFGLIETMLVRADGSIPRLDAHLGRLERSAFACGIPIDIECVRASLFPQERAVAGARIAMVDRDDERMRRAGSRGDESDDRVVRSARDEDDRLLRLEVSRSGEPSVTIRRLESMGDPIVLVVTSARVSSTDPAFRHKTTRRSAYERAAREARSARASEGLLLDECGRIADGSRTTFFCEIDGALATPLLANGAVAGILRDDLLASGRAYERSLTPDEIRSRDVFVGNAARGLLRACFSRR